MFPLFRNLSTNLLTGLTPGTLDSLTSLEELELDSNALQFILGGSLDGLTALRHLDLTLNSVTHVDAQALSTLTALASIDVRLNNLSAFTFLQSPNLLRLAESDSVVEIFPQRQFDACVANARCLGISDVCISTATCKSTFGADSHCCASSRGACRTCTGNASVLRSPVCVQCHDCDIDDCGNTTVSTASPRVSATVNTSVAFHLAYSQESCGSRDEVYIGVLSVPACAMACNARGFTAFSRARWTNHAYRCRSSDTGWDIDECSCWCSNDPTPNAAPYPSYDCYEITPVISSSPYFHVSCSHRVNDSRDAVVTTLDGQCVSSNGAQTCTFLSQSANRSTVSALI